MARWQTETLIPLRISTAAPVQAWPQSRVTLIGDAGELTRALSAAGAEEIAALSDYRDRMTDYAVPRVAASRSSGQTRVGQH